MILLPEQQLELRWLKPDHHCPLPFCLCIPVAAESQGERGVRIRAPPQLCNCHFHFRQVSSSLHLNFFHILNKQYKFHEATKFSHK